MPWRVLASAIVAAPVLWALNAADAVADNETTSTSESPAQQVIAVVPGNWPPQYDVDRDGNPVGFAIDVTNEVAARAGLKVLYRVVDNFAAVEEAMAAGEADIIPNSGITPEREAQYYFTSSVQTSVISIFVRNGTTGIDGIGDLAGRVVGIVETSVGENIAAANPSFKPRKFKDAVSALFGLLSGEVDAVIYARGVILAMARKVGVDDRITVAGEPIMEIKRAIRVRKDRPDLLARLDKAVTEFVGTSDYQAIYVKWYGRATPFWTTRRAALAMALLASVLLVFFAWSRHRLMVKVNRRTAASEEKFRDLIEGAVPGVLIHRDHELLFVNRSYARIFGYDDPEEMMGQGSALDHAAAHERGRLKSYAAARLAGEDAPAAYEFEGIRKDGTRIWLENRSRVVDWEGAPAIQRTVVDVTDKRRAEKELMLRSSQQAVIAELGQRALVSDDIQSLMSLTVVLVAKMLSADFCKILEMMPGNEGLLLRAGWGWKPGFVGRATVANDKTSQAGFTLLQHEAVVVEDLRRERRFEAPPLLRDHGIISGVSVIIGDPGDPIGILAVHMKSPRLFSDDDVMFLKTVAVMLAAAIGRRRADDAVRASESRLRGAIESLQEGFALYDADDRLVLINDVYRRVSPRANEFLAQNARFEDMLRSNVEKGWIMEARGREEAFIRERLEHRRNPKGMIVRQHADGRWYLIKETRTPEGGVAVTFTDVTELKRVEMARRDSEERYRAVADSIGDAIIAIDDQNTIVQWNNGARLLFGYEDNEILGQPLSRLMPERYRERHAAGIARVKRTGESGVVGRTLELAGLRKDGVEFPVEISVGTWSAGGKTYFSGIVRDITERKRADRALRDTQQRLQNLVDNLPVGVNVKDLDGRFVLVNGRFEEFYGLSPGSVIGKLPEEVSELMTISAPRREAHEKRVVETGTVISRDDKLLGPDGKVRDYEIIKFPIFDADGRVSLVGTIASDVTERKRVADAFRRNEVLFRTVVNHSPTKIHIKDLRGRYILINKVAEKLFGITDGDSRSKTSHDLFPKKVADGFVDHDQAVIDSRRAVEREEHFTVDGEKHTFLTVKFPIFEGDRVTAVGAIGTDITKRKQEEKNLAELQAELAHVSRISTMGEMAAGLAHELNQPLTAITNYAKGTLRRLHAGGDTVDLLPIMELVAEQALRAGEIIREIRRFMNRTEPRKSRIDIGRTIDEVMALLAGEFNMSGIEVAVEVPQTLPPVMAHSIQVQQVLLNLIRNAVAAMDGGGDNYRRLEIGAAANGMRDVEIYVRDNGPGIPPDVKERLFEPFFTTKTDGLGMGLSISRSIVAGHQGRIWALSEMGKGASFHFTLPAGTGERHDAA